MGRAVCAAALGCLSCASDGFCLSVRVVGSLWGVLQVWQNCTSASMSSPPTVTASLAGSVSARRLERAMARSAEKSISLQPILDENNELPDSEEWNFLQTLEANAPVTEIPATEAAATEPPASAPPAAAAGNLDRMADKVEAADAPDEIVPIDAAPDGSAMEAESVSTAASSTAKTVEEYTRTKELLEKLLDMQRKDQEQRAAGSEGMAEPEQQRLDEKISATMAKLATLSAAVPVDYFTPECVFATLARADVRLLSARWLVNYAGQSHGGGAEGGGGGEGSSSAAAVLPRRQDLPAEAFLSLETLMRMHDDAPDDDVDGPKPYNASHKRLPVVYICHAMHSSSAADDEQGSLLRAVAAALTEQLPAYAAHGYVDMGVYLDWSSRYQPPYAKEEEAASARRALESSIQLWPSHALLTAYLVPSSVVGKSDDGWMACTTQLAWLAKPAERVWPQVLDLTSGEARARPAPLPPWAFAGGGVMAGCSFHDEEDRGVCAHAARGARSQRHT